ncbi:hypothetical protein CKO35_10220, partial [Ectothiorhodospira shaposhnikovii]|nr:hypothetical protein [Ectothiorhodospira shaposhnikovii]
VRYNWTTSFRRVSTSCLLAHEHLQCIAYEGLTGCPLQLDHFIAMLAHATVRPRARAWVEQCWLAAAAFALLPVLNALTTDRHLGQSLPEGDWVMAGFDLAMLGLGGTFAAIAWMLGRRMRSGLSHKRDARSSLMVTNTTVPARLSE